MDGFENEDELIEDIRKSLNDIDAEIGEINALIMAIVEVFEATGEKLPARGKRAFGYGIITYLAQELGMDVQIGDTQ